MSAPPPYPGGNTGGYPQPQPGMHQPGMQQPGYAPPPQAYGPPPTQVNVQAPPNITVVHAPGGGCPSCHAPNSFTDNYGCCAICLAILFFPIGILCCLAMRDRRCVNCGYTQ